MNRSAHFRTEQGWLISLVVLVAAAWVGVQFAPLVRRFVSYQASQHALNAEQAPSTTAQIIEYKLALALAPQNSDYHLKLARLYLAAGDSGQALNTLQDDQDPSATVVRAGIYLEQGSAANAISAFQDASTADGLELLGLAYALNRQPSKALEVANGAGEKPREALQRAANSELALAQELYARGLYSSSRQALKQIADQSSASQILLAHTYLAQPPHTRESLLQAQSAAQQAVALDPSSTTAHELLRDVDQKLGDQSGSTKEDDIVRRLKNGQI